MSKTKTKNTPLVITCPECRGKGHHIEGGSKLVIDIQCFACVGAGRITPAKAKALAKAYREDIKDAESGIKATAKKMAILERSVASSCDA